jgi:hypothetical protein
VVLAIRVGVRRLRVQEFAEPAKRAHPELVCRVWRYESPYLRSWLEDEGGEFGADASERGFHNSVHKQGVGTGALGGTRVECEDAKKADGTTRATT